MGIVGLLSAAACAGGAESLLSGANARPEGSRVLARLANDGPSPVGPPAHVAVLLIDGMRLDEARALPAWRSLRGRSRTGVVRLRAPTLSRPFYHHLFTGVPSDISGVRTNRFSEHARHDSVMDRVRAAGGRVWIAADDLDWMRRMHGAPEDGGSDAAGALAEPLDGIVAEWREAPAPALLVVHFVATDATAHAGGIASGPHQQALSAADRLIARIAESSESAGLFVLSDHGHRRTGGHGGAEAEVARSPILFRAPGGEETEIASPVDADTLAPSLSLALGVARPREAIGVALPELSGRVPRPDRWSIRAASVADASRALSAENLSVRRRRVFPIALFLLFMALGPIKRAFGFHPSMLLALTLPLLVVGAHLGLGRPLSLSAIDERGLHVARIFVLGVSAAFVSTALARLASRGGGPTATRRAAATAGWAAAALGLLTSAGAGFALGPWFLSPLAFYLPLLGCGAAAGGLVAASAVLIGSALAEKRAG